MAKSRRKEFIGGPLDGMVVPREALDSAKDSIAAKVSNGRYAIHVRRFDDGVRRIERIAEVTGIENLTPQLQDLYVFQQSGRDSNGIRGEFHATGIIPRIAEDLLARGVELPKQELFGRGN